MMVVLMCGIINKSLNFNVTVILSLVLLKYVKIHTNILKVNRLHFHGLTAELIWMRLDIDVDRNLKKDIGYFCRDNQHIHGCSCWQKLVCYVTSQFFGCELIVCYDYLAINKFI